MTSDTRQLSPAFYPRRARGLRAFWLRWHAMQRELNRQRLSKPRAFTAAEGVLHAVVPGHAFWAAGWRTVGAAVLAAWLVLALVVICWLGHSASNVAFGLMISAHVTSILFWLGSHLREWPLAGRLLFNVMVLVATAGLVYVPARDRLLRTYLPLRIDDRVFVLQRSVPANKIRTGDLIGYEVPAEIRERGVVVREGYGLERVLAMGGDRVQFAPDHFEINGVPAARRPQMPSSGEVVVPEKHWFVWPRFDIVNRNPALTNVGGALVQSAMIAETQYIGRARDTWFGRRTPLP